LEVPEHYDLLASVHSWIYPDIQPVPEQTGERFFTRIYEIDGVRVPIVIEQDRPGEQLSVSHPSVDVSKSKAEKLLKDVLGLKVQMKNATAILSKDPLLSSVATHVSGIQPYLSPTVYEALLKTIIQQQISYRAANVLTKRMILQLSQKMNYKGRTIYAFPEPDAISTYGLDGLREFGFGYKAEYIYSVNKLVRENSLDTEALKSLPYAEVTEILKPIRGIGEWTIRTLAIAGLGNFTVFPCDDLGVRNLMGRIYHDDGSRMTTPEVEDFAQNWGKDWPLVLYLLMSADVLGLFGQQGRQQMHKRA